jgi:hypothetical protein
VKGADDADGAAAALEVAETAMARAETRMRGLSRTERTAAAGRVAEARGLPARVGRRVRGGDFGGGAWLCVTEAVVVAEAVAPPGR